MSMLTEAIRTANNKARWSALYGRPEDGDYTDAEAYLQAQEEEKRKQAEDSAVARSSGPGSSPGTSPGSMPPATAFPGGPLAARDQGRGMTLGNRQPAGQVPLGIREANPEAYFDERSGSTVIGASGRSRNAIGGNTVSGGAVKDGVAYLNSNNATYGMPGRNERRAPIGGRATPPAPDMFGRQFGSAPDTSHLDADGYTTARPADMSNIGPDGYTRSGGKRNYAEGGTIVGLGGPRDDAVPGVIDGTKQPIRVSDGEEIVDAETRDMFGRKFFIDLKKKARKLKEEEMQFGVRGQGSGAGADHKPPATNHQPPARGYRDGGTVTGNNPAYERFLALRDRHNDPANVVADQRDAQDAELAQIGMQDLGGGRRTLSNRYGTGYALPDSGGADLIADENGLMRNTGTPQRPRLEPMPDIVPAGSPWAASSGQMPDLQFGQRTESNRAMINQMQDDPMIPQRRDMDSLKTTAALQQKPSNYKPLPNASNVMPKLATTRQREAMPPRSEPFRSPSEKDAERAAAADAASGRPSGVRRSDWRNFQRSPQGIEFALETAQGKDKRKSATTWSDVPNSDYQINEMGNLVHKNTGKRAGITADEAQTLGLQLDSVDSDGKARWKRPADKSASGNEGRVVMLDKKPFIMHADGTYSEATNRDAVSDEEKIGAFLEKHGKKPSSADDWSAAWYLAREKKMRSSAPAGGVATPAPAATSNISKADYDALKPGQTYTWNGQQLTKK